MYWRLAALKSQRSSGGEVSTICCRLAGRLLRCCAGLDGHKTSAVAWVRRIPDSGRLEEQVRSFGTTTAEVLALADGLAGHGVGQVAMESTGVSWKPDVHLLEPHFEVMLVNARHLKKVPGRTTDVTDSQ
jgi:transposase